MARLILALALTLCGCREWVRDSEQKANQPADSRWHGRGMESGDLRGNPHKFSLDFDP